MVEILAGRIIPLRLFFGSFFAAKTGTANKKKGAAVMEAPPPMIKPQSALNERETMETEVISCVFCLELLLNSFIDSVTSQKH